MVPHRSILRAIVLASHASLSPDDVRAVLCTKYHVKFPRDFVAFVATEILAYVTPEVEALLMTKDPSKIDYRSELLAAEQLGVKCLGVTPQGLTVVLPDIVTKLRKHDTLRLCIETMLLCNISRELIVEDVRNMYGISLTTDDIALFADLFMDTGFAEGDSWIEYTQCIGVEETKFKYQLMNAPKDYARWKLGARVQLDSEQVLDRLMSDSYYLSQQMRIENPEPSRDDMSRMKLERDTIFKAMDRRLKIKDQKAQTGEKGSQNAHTLIANILMKYDDDVPPLASSLDSNPA